jgi:hypothetical protein
MFVRSSGALSDNDDILFGIEGRIVNFAKIMSYGAAVDHRSKTLTVL